ncbi:MAG: hypothetical protein ACR2LK_14075 [Solirubrobacteraceae bacterium]
MSAPAIILLIIAVLVVTLGIGGYIAMGRRTRDNEEELVASLQRAERELAQAHASDKGWDRDTLEAAAHAAVAERFGAADVQALQLIQVIDKPGTDADQAVFRVQTDAGEHTITLGRTGGVWGAA